MDEGKERKRAAAARTHLDVAGRTIALARPRDDGARRRRFENLAGRLRFVPLPQRTALLLLSYHASSSRPVVALPVDASVGVCRVRGTQQQ